MPLYRVATLVTLSLVAFLLSTCGSSNNPSQGSLGPNSCTLSGGGGSPPTPVCVDYSGSGWVNQAADSHCHALALTCSPTCGLAFYGIKNCADANSGSTRVGHCTVRSGQSDENVFNYYGSSGSSDCTARGGTYSAG